LRSSISVPEFDLKLVSSQRMDDRLLVTNYNAKITDLHGEIEARMACIANQVYLMACFCGRPELDIELVNTDSRGGAGIIGSSVTPASTPVQEMMKRIGQSTQVVTMAS
uniref:Hydantoinase_B domain-containing protein n=1 Tax=Gongylonema pulchrum TaxID=637853 RepID=A0A183EP30_9BILA